VGEVGAGDEEHRERGQDQDGRRAEVRLAEDEEGDGRDDEQERQRPAPERPDPDAPTGAPVGHVHDQGELGELGGVDGGQRAQLDPAGRPADDDRVQEPALGEEQDEPQQGEGDEVARDRHEPQQPVVDPHRDDHGQDAERRPLDLGPDEGERVRLAQVGAHGRRRVDHQDADGGESEDGDEDRQVRLVAFAAERLARLGRRPGGLAHVPAAQALAARAGGIAAASRLARPTDRTGDAHRSLLPVSAVVAAVRSRARAATASLKARPRAA
jgi:hypothetical protein